MKKLLCFIFSLLLILPAFSQEEPLYSQYKSNAFVLNPAVAGTRMQQEVRINYRLQWRNFPGAPRTATVSYTGRFDNKNSIGVMAFSDALGPSLRNGAQLAYAYRLPLGYGGSMGQNMLSFGMGLKYIQQSFRVERVTFQDQADPAIAAAMGNLNLADLSFGALYYNDNLWLGFSAPNLIQGNLSAVGNDPSTRANISRLYTYYFLFGGYRFKYDNLTVEPSVLVKRADATPYQIEGTIRFYLMDEKLIVGGSYRTDWLASLMFGMRVKNMEFLYSSDFMTRAQPGNVFGASHEFTLGLDLQGWKDYYGE
ncbi:MAG: type IX secretion system membrane protein PorP/SprF [Bacteroidia bacterium]|nr:type IX secretion system membrane protein PorP/SprF [Bacteroidia bacterium]